MNTRPKSSWELRAERAEARCGELLAALKMIWFEGKPARYSTKPPKPLDAIVDVVLAYRPKAKTKPARSRKRRAAKIARGKPNV